MEQELAYSFYLGSDKNKSKLAKKVSKGNVSGTTSFSNNAIQNAKGLSKVNKHNLRDYDNQRERITTIYGTNDIVEDVKQVYLDEFEQSRIEYNSKTRADRQIKDYFQKVCDSQNDIACEIIGSTSFSNNAIQNAKDLSKANKHNLRDYDNQRELITTIYGTNDIVEDVKQVYLDEFEQARIEYNAKTRAYRQIKDYFQKVCDSQNDIACEIIIELGDMDFWQDKDNEYRYKMTDVYNEQVQELSL
ncbi:mobilization protein [Clostridium sp. CAG:567]|nr:mobilization protein [Clostridium sp. CAG:567]